MAVSPEPPRKHRHHPNPLSHLLNSTLLPLIPNHKAAPPSLASPPPPPKLLLPVRLPPALSIASPSDSAPPPPHPTPLKPAPEVKAPAEPGAAAAGAFPSTVRISAIKSNGKGRGPAFVGQVFSMCDLSGTGLMAVSTHFDVPFLSKRTPEWLKKVFASITKSERNGPVFRFFMDLGDAVTYVKRLNIPSGVVGACRLDLAYEHFKEKPHLFQFVPNEKQVKAANKLLKTISQGNGNRQIDGVPVFSAQNLDIAIATSDGIKWYTPYFFDKNMLDNILEESVEQHFHSLIQTRHMQRRRDVIDDNLTEVADDVGDSLWEPPEVQEVLEEMGHPGIPLSVISKAAEMQLLYAVDRVILGNRWLRKATGIQPKFPYIVDSFERRTAASLVRASDLTHYLGDRGMKTDESSQESTDKLALEENHHVDLGQKADFRFPFGDWLRHPWSKEQQKLQKEVGARHRLESLTGEPVKQKLQPNPFLPKITMVGISMGEAGQANKATLKKTMEDLTRELEQTDHGNAAGNIADVSEDRDPLFVANVGDYYSGLAKTGSARLIRRSEAKKQQ
ncbi:uncharacterized protein LOC104448180 isoform X1 [Eucalyptus grandis]|uniref:uncharacterized protein LOC104448180 isoform X1 n=1 Tax=Eucalyptus grandis TaxID=71139 RepID=UPI00192F09A9|nr:uncharacterized protein LOC104448180 isoform X1 [Eucalyptus grandis]